MKVEKIIIIVIIIFGSQGLRCHMLNMHKDLCLQRSSVLAYLWSPESARLHKPIGAWLPPSADNLILESEGGGWGKILQWDREENFNWVFIFQFLCYSFCGRLHFPKKGATTSSVLRAGLQCEVAILTWTLTGGSLSPLPESHGLWKKKDRGKQIMQPPPYPLEHQCWRPELPGGKSDYLEDTTRWRSPGDIKRSHVGAEGRGLQMIPASSCLQVTPSILGFAAEATDRMGKRQAIPVHCDWIPDPQQPWI